MKLYLGDASSIAGLVFLLAMLVWLYFAFIRPRLFRSTLRRIAIENGWEIFGEEKRDGYTRIGMRGSHLGTPFELREIVSIRRYKAWRPSSRGTGVRRTTSTSHTSRWVLSAPGRHPLATGTYQLSSTGEVTTHGAPVEVPAGFASWWLDQNGVTREFDTSQDGINIRLGDSMNEAKLFRNLDFLAGLAARL